MTLVVDVEQLGTPGAGRRKWDALEPEAAGRFTLLEPKRRMREERSARLGKCQWSCASVVVPASVILLLHPLV